MDYSDLVFFPFSEIVFQQPQQQQQQLATAVQIIQIYLCKSFHKTEIPHGNTFNGRIARSIASIFVLLHAKNVYKMNFFFAFEHVIEFLGAFIFVPFRACIDAYSMNNDSDDKSESSEC